MKHNQHQTSMSIVSSFFSRATHCSPEVIAQIEQDVGSVEQSFSFTLHTATWGGTQQERLCLHGGLPISDGTRPASASSLFLPLQVWLTHHYPVAPPDIFAVGPQLAVGPDEEEEQLTAVLPYVRSVHPNVDHTGRCYCEALSQWNPRSINATPLLHVLKGLADEVAKNGYPFVLRPSPISRPVARPADPPTNEREPAEEDQCVVCYGKKDVVFVPCGHYCCCQSCAGNIPECPVCRRRITVRQPLSISG